MACRIQIAQLNPLVGDVVGNATRIIDWSVRAREAGADLVVFPELALTGYPPEDLLLRPEFIQRVETALERIRAEVAGITLVLGYPLRALGGLFNVAGVLRDGQVIAEYAKQHLPNYSVFDEKRYFQAGATPTIFTHAGLRFGLSVCEDIWHDGPTRQAAEAGAQILINLNASPFHAGKRTAREALVARRAGDHGLTILYANLVGGQDELVFDGASFVMDRSGQVIARAPGFGEAVLTLDLDDAGIPVNPDPLDSEAPLEDEASIYSALVLGVRDYVRKNGFSGAVLGLSGGVDSALTLAIAVDALGAGQVEAVLMPSRYTADMSNEDALEQARRLEVTTRIIPIEPAFQTFLGMLEPVFAGQPADVTEENIQARCRGVILMAISNKSGRILLTTGNKSEMAVGYATLYGDMAGGFAPIKDVPKMLVYRLARYRNTIAPVIPERVLTRAPSAELRPDQTDQDSLPPYEILDAILRLYIEEDEGIDAIVARGHAADVVRRVTRLVDRNEYKRRQAPPGVRISQRAFGRDRRYPLTSGF
ncbi:NAD+ synthase (glutamine-hydrolysing) [Thiobaca trueperi]|uniref:Glutamine-dependent NAD(+) synthetase n=1 Tax=Thiobaca trueperi TaxID=127458 RepID=A0A4R3MWT1_9GAMM|nr:NAD+ synthase [Thiobaca trueperi]TCT19203.1 NAD+ synthase (glutamine-hydrolysing) [Thiobaca trueperi]